MTNRLVKSINIVISESYRTQYLLSFSINKLICHFISIWYCQLMYRIRMKLHNIIHSIPFYNFLAQINRHTKLINQYLSPIPPSALHLIIHFISFLLNCHHSPLPLFHHPSHPPLLTINFCNLFNIFPFL